MELQELAFLGRVGQFLKPRSCLGANISLNCLASEGSQESMQEGGSCRRVSLPFTSKGDGSPNAHRWSWGGCSRAREMQKTWMGSPIGQGWGIR